jgi:hypothetical protein
MERRGPHFAHEGHSFMTLDTAAILGLRTARLLAGSETTSAVHTWRKQATN